jgi:flavorubredoxin
MNAIVVYESHWGNTAAIARAIAEGIGLEARAMSTGQATGEVIAGADVIVAGAPQMGFSLPTEGMLKGIAADAGRAPAPPDVSHPAMRTWLDGLQKGSCCAAAFETAGWWSPGSATRTILRKLEAAGYRPISKARRFSVHGMYGPLREGELEKAKAWGAELAQAVK